MAEERLKDAEVLLAGGRWAFAYYVAGYAVECALKACLLKRMVITGWVFDESTKKAKEYLDDCRTHDFSAILRVAGMQKELDEKHKDFSPAGDEFRDNWKVVKGWKVESRYDPTKSEAEARTLIAAITDEPNGVMIWIRNYW
jgi:HEPN domain-containing protein